MSNTELRYTIKEASEIVGVDYDRTRYWLKLGATGPFRGYTRLLNEDDIERLTIFKNITSFGIKTDKALLYVQKLYLNNWKSIKIIRGDSNVELRIIIKPKEHEIKKQTGWFRRFFRKGGA